MISLARANLVHDWRRHATAIVVLVLAGLLMTSQLGLVTGFIESQTQLIRQLQADLIIERSRTASRGGGPFGGFGPAMVETRHISHILMHPDVVSAEPYSRNGGRGQWRNDQGVNEYVDVRIADPDDDSLTYLRRFPEEVRDVLRVPGHIVATSEAARKLQVKVGDTGNFNDSPATIGAIIDGIPGAFIPIVFVSSQTARLTNSAPASRWSTNFLVGLKPDADATRVAAELNRMLAERRLTAVLPQDFASSYGLTQLFSSSFGWILLGSAAFGLVVGCGIASQTLRGAFLAQLREFGSLRALGVSRARMALVAMEQAALTGLAAVPITLFLSFVVRTIAQQFDIVLGLSPTLLIGTSVLLLAVAIIAGLISLTAVTKVEPAELLR